jgi:hypothetical protein
MRKRIVALLALVIILFSGVASSTGSYDFSDMRSDADTVYAYFSGSDSSAARAFMRLYDLWYQDSQDYVMNSNSCKFHLPTCSGVKTMNPSNKILINCSRELLVLFGYEPCKNCHP